MRRIAFYGGSFDPPHLGHLMIGERLTEIFGLSEFVFIPAFHAPHKLRKKPTSALHRFAMLALATKDNPRLKLSKMELEAPETPYTIETLTKLKHEYGDSEVYFVMGADSWEEIDTWRDWQQVLSIVNIIVVTRPGFEIGFSHVTDDIRRRIVDRREKADSGFADGRVDGETDGRQKRESKIEISDAVSLAISATDIRRKIKSDDGTWRELVPREVAKYIEKYDIY